MEDNRLWTLWTLLCPLERGEGGGGQRVDGEEHGVLSGLGQGLTCQVGRELRSPEYKSDR